MRLFREAGDRIRKGQLLVVFPEGTRSRDGALLISDEVMTGMGRTGDWFGIDRWGITPDVMCLAKGVSGGYLPLSVTATCCHEPAASAGIIGLNLGPLAETQLPEAISRRLL